MSKFDLITENIDEIIGEGEIKKILEERDIVIYWGTTPSSIPNIIYFIPLINIMHFKKHGCQVKILLADIHAYLNSIDLKFEIFEHRTDIHEKILKYMIRFLDKDEDSDISFVQGTSFQLNTEYTMDTYKFNALCTISRLKDAGKNIINQIDEPLMTSLLYPTLQALDIEYLEADVFFGDYKQKDICILTNEVLEKMGYKKKTFFLNEVYTNLKNMPKITLIDSYENIENKINLMYIKDVLFLINIIIFDICQIKNILFKIKDFEFTSLTQIALKYRANEINIDDIKQAVILFLDRIIEPMRNEFNEEDMIEKLILAKYIS
jgi:tyrosyl-tRNA synthetase